MIDVSSRAKINIHWNVSPYDYSKEAENAIISKMAKKYGLPKDRVKVVPEFLMIGDDGKEVSLNSDVIQNTQDPHFQLKLFKTFLDVNKVENYDFELIKKIDAEINEKIDYTVYDKFKRYSLKWIKWDNFLSYGSGNVFDFSSISGLTSLSGENQSGKTTLSIDLIHFLLFGKTKKASTQDKVFNKHMPEATTVTVEGCITIDGTDYVIKRTLTRPALSRRSDKSKTTQKVEYYRVVGDAMEELEEWETENQQEENGIQTNKVIKEAIGSEADFDLIMSVTESTLDDLVEKKDTDRGRLFARWIGLLPIEEKEKVAREKFNSDIKPMLYSNRFNAEQLEQEIAAFNVSIDELATETKNLTKENKALDKDVKALEKAKEAIIQSKSAVDASVLKVDITTLLRRLEECKRDGIRKSEEIASIDKEIAEIGDVEFSVEEYDALSNEIITVNGELASTTEKYKFTDKMLKDLKSSEFCPTCGRKLDNVDNSKKISEMEKEIDAIVKLGKELSSKSSMLSKRIEKLKEARDKYNKKSNMTVKKAALEVNRSKLREEYKELTSTKSEYERNKEAIDKNNSCDIEIRNTDEFIRAKRQKIDTNNMIVATNNANTERYKKDIKDRKEIIEKLKEEEVLVRNWKIYIELVGKNGISKMVLRKTLPIINAKLARLLNDICDFDVEVAINNRNDVMFYLVKDGVRSELSSGSGFELTASGIALRSVLSELSTIPKSSILTLDELWGRVHKDNYENIRTLIERVSKQYEAVFLISHNSEVYDWCDSHVAIVKENNISKVVLK